MSETETINVAGHSVTLPRLDTRLLSSMPHKWHLGCLAAIDTFHKAKISIEADRLLSADGKAAKLEPMQCVLWDELLSTAEALDRFEASIEKQEANLVAVPEPSGPVGVANDREARDWWRSQDVETRAKLLRDLAEVGENGQAAFTKYQALWMAILRSPIPLPDLEMKAVQDIWASLCRLDNPVAYERIRSDRAALDWGRRSHGHLVGVATRITEWSKERIASHAVATKREAAALKIGVSARDLALAQARTL